ncbi:Mpv17-like protein [Aphelenchoides besseyi]|nr:Mpv17-like protein [Aphelenchoides besseyi]
MLVTSRRCFVRTVSAKTIALTPVLSSSYCALVNYLKADIMASIWTKIAPSKTFLMQSSMAGSLAITGDVACQLIVEKQQKWDMYRSLRFGFVISCIAAPIQFKWFRFLEKHIRPSQTRFMTGVKKMLADQIVAAPLLTSLMLFSVQLLQSRSVDYSIARVKSIFPTVIATNYKVWPLVQIINMSLVSLRLVLIISVYLDSVKLPHCIPSIHWNVLGCIGILGDATCQFLVDRRSLPDYDPIRGLRFFVLPTFYIAPILSQWFKVLDRIPGNTRFSPLKRVMVDQIFFAPPFSASIIFNLHLLQGYSISQSWDKLQEHFFDIYKRSILYWPFIVPLRYRVIVVQMAALVWNAFLSFKTQSQEPIPPLE